MIFNKERFDVRLSLGSWIYLAGLLGLCGGLVLSVLGALMALIDGEYGGAFVALFVGPLVTIVYLAVFALIGYPIYRWVSVRWPNSRILAGSFERAPIDRGGMST